MINWVMQDQHSPHYVTLILTKQQYSSIFNKAWTIYDGSCDLKYCSGGHPHINYVNYATAKVTTVELKIFEG